MKLFKRITSLLLALLLIFTSLPIYSEASGTFKTDLIDGLITKSDRLTFDLWAKDASGTKIEASQIEVLNNQKTVTVNWDDQEKTSYTLHLELGQNIITITSGTQSLTYTITREFAKDGDVIGHFTFSLDAFTLGLGYIIEPIQVPIIKGRTSAEELDEILRNAGFTYKSTGNIKSGFYLSTIFKNNLFDKPIQIPDVLKSKLNGNYNESDYSLATGLGEFDINFMSGWMYSINNVFPNVGFSDKYLIDGDIMRVQFTLAYGQDIGGGEAMGGDGSNYFTKVNKDALTKKISTIHSVGKSSYLINSTRIAAYQNALNILAELDASQDELDAALSQLQLADSATVADGSVHIEAPATPPPTTNIDNQTDKETSLSANRVISQIQVLPSMTSLAITDAPAIQTARQVYDALPQEAKELVTNYAKLVQLEQQLSNLQTSSGRLPDPTQSAVQKVIEQIASLPTTITAGHEQSIKQARHAYDSLSNEHKLAVVNYSLLLLAEINFAKLAASNTISNTKVSQSQILISNLPTTITSNDKKAIEEARASYNALNAAEKASIKNYDKLLSAELALANLALEIDKAVQAVSNLIAGLPTTITETDRAIVEKVEATFKKLSAAQQQQVTNKELLVAAINQLQTTEEFVINNGNAILLNKGSIFDMTVEGHVLQQIVQNPAVQTITFELMNQAAISVSKSALQNTGLSDLHIELHVITIGQKKELVASFTGKEALTIPATLHLPTATWSNGYFLKNGENGFEAVPHFAENGTVSVQVTSNESYAYTTAQVTFTDIASLNNSDEIQYLANRYVIQGSNGLFKPSNSITRAQFAVMITRALGAKPTTETKFNDIKGKWFEDEIQALYELKIITGVSDRTFNPNASLTRQHAATIMARLLRHAGLQQPTNYNLTYSDADSINSHYVADVAWLQELNIMSGSQGKFSPNNSLTRAQMAKILKRTLNTAKIM